MATTTTTAIDQSVDGVKVEDLAQIAVVEDVEAATAAMEVEREDTIPMVTTMVEEEEIAVIAAIAAIAAVEVKGAAIAAMEEEEGEEEESTTMATTTPMERVAVTGVTAVKRWRLQRNNSRLNSIQNIIIRNNEHNSLTDPSDSSVKFSLHAYHTLFHWWLYFNMHTIMNEQSYL